MKPLTKDEIILAKQFCKKEKKLFWLCCYNIAMNKNRLLFM